MALTDAKADQLTVAENFGSDDPYIPIFGPGLDQDMTRFGVIVGDLLANLRSALDHAVNGLAGADAGEFTKFPIYTDRRKFERDAPANLAGVPHGHRAQIKRMQPYHGHRRGRVLLFLNELVNVDKHRVLRVAVVVSDFTVQIEKMPDGTRRKHREPSFADGTGMISMIDDETEFAYRTERPPVAESNMDAERRLYLLFGDRGGSISTFRASRLDLRFMLDEVALILRELRAAI